MPLPRVHLVRYGGFLAPHSQLRRLITPTPRQQGAEAPAASASPHWSWARLLKRVFAFDLERCPACGRGTLRIIAAITQAEVIRTILRHLKLATTPGLPPPEPPGSSHRRSRLEKPLGTQIDRMARMTLHRPEKRRALSQALLLSILKQLTQIE